MRQTKKTFFSIVIPLFNKVAHINRAIDSILAQTVQDFEVIVINDGSTDGSEHVVMDYTDERIKLINQENFGVSAARNLGIENATSEYITFLDADDEWLLGFLESIQFLIEKYPEASAFATAYSAKMSNGEKLVLSFDPIPSHPWDGIIANYFENRKNNNTPLWSSAVCIKKDVFENVGVFPLDLKVGEDIDLWIRIFLNYKIAFTTKVQAIYHLDSNNRASHNANYLIENQKFLNSIQRRLQNGEIPSLYIDDVREIVNQGSYKNAKNLILTGNRTDANKIFSEYMNYFDLKQKFNIGYMLLIPFFLIKFVRYLKRKVV